MLGGLPAPDHFVTLSDTLMGLETALKAEVQMSKRPPSKLAPACAIPMWITAIHQTGEIHTRPAHGLNFLSLNFNT